MSSTRSRPFTAPSPAQTPHPPLGRTRLLSDEELEELERERQMSPGVLSSIAGTIRQRTRSVLHRPEPPHQEGHNDSESVYPVPLTHITVPDQKYDGTGVYDYGLPADSHKTEYGGAASVSSRTSDRHIQFMESPRPGGSTTSLAAPTPPPHGEERHSARRQFSFQNVFRRHQADRVQDQALPPMDEHPHRHGMRARGYSERGVKVKNATEEERLGLVMGDSQSMPTLPRYDRNSDDLDDDDDDDDGDLSVDEKRAAGYGRVITNSPPRRKNDESDDKEAGEVTYQDSQRGWRESRHRSQEASPRVSPPRSQPYRVPQSF